MSFVVKSFEELSNHELYEIYKLRSRVFIVEQNCAYQDVDEKDLKAFHIMLYEKEKLIAYSRIIPPGPSHDEPSIGRVVVAPEKRGTGIGKTLMNYTLQRTAEFYKNHDIVISAQCYLLKFYSELGFVVEETPYDEDGIPHQKMRYKAIN